MSEDFYIWVTRWPDFQHYKPNPDRGPAWIKQHNSQMNDDRYLDLQATRRALIHDVRMLFSMFRGRLVYDARKIARYRSCHTRDADLKALADAGLIEVVSRATLEQRLDKFYSRSRAEVEVEKEKEQPPLPQPSTYNGRSDSWQRASDREPLPDLEHVLKDMPL